MDKEKIIIKIAEEKNKLSTKTVTKGKTNDSISVFAVVEND